MNTINEKLKVCDFEGALDLLDEALKLEQNVSDFDFSYNHALLLKKIPSHFFVNRGFLVKRIAVLGGFNTSYISALLILNLYKRGIFAQIYEASYGTMEALIYSKDTELSNFSPELCYLCVGTPHINLKDLSQYGLEIEMKRWGNLLHQINEWLNCQIIINNFVAPIERTYGNFELRANSVGAFVSNLNEILLKIKSIN
jgi:predicted enzyme involved in methoxymalonyl-ACP biosynthesis